MILLCVVKYCINTKRVVNIRVGMIIIKMCSVFTFVQYIILRQQKTIETFNLIYTIEKSGYRKKTLDIVKIQFQHLLK